MGKLVRDGVPDLIREGNKAPVCRVLSREEFRQELLSKLVEEAQEAADAQSKHLSTDGLVGLIDELADLAEVTEAILAEFNISSEQVRFAQLKKRLRTGAFSRRMYLE